MFDDEFMKWMGQYEKAVKDGVFEEAPKPKEPKDSSFFGLSSNYENEDIKDSDIEHWNKVISANDYPDQVLNENKERAKKAEKLANTPNPVQYPTTGKDQEYRADWVDDKIFEQLESLKKQLYALESKLNAAEGVGKKTNGVQDKIDKIKEQLDELSDSFSPNFVTSSNK
jgi:hypothetical protein